MANTPKLTATQQKLLTRVWTEVTYFDVCTAFENHCARCARCIDGRDCVMHAEWVRRMDRARVAADRSIGANR